MAPTSESEQVDPCGSFSSRPTFSGCTRRGDYAQDYVSTADRLRSAQGGAGGWLVDCSAECGYNRGELARHVRPAVPANRRRHVYIGDGSSRFYQSSRRGSIIGAGRCCVHAGGVPPLIRQPYEIPRRELGETGQQLSVVGFGGIVVMNETPESAAQLVAQAIERDINYFDVAPSYGNAEQRLGPASSPYRTPGVPHVQDADADAQGRRVRTQALAGAHAD